MTFIQIAFIRIVLLHLPDRHHHHHCGYNSHLANARWQVLLFSSPGHSVVVRVDCTQLNITTSDSSDALATLYTGTFGTSQSNCDGISVTLHSSLHHIAVLWSEDDGIVHTTQFCTSLQVLLSLRWW